jgi:hypothetical protein
MASDLKRVGPQPTIQAMRRLSALALLLALAGADAAAAADRVQVVPSRLEATAGRGDLLPPVRVLNRGSAPLVVKAVAVPARQDVSGLPVYDFSAASRRTGAAMFGLSKRELRVPPGESRSVRVRVLGCPRSGLGTYGVVGLSATRQSARPGQVTPVVRLASTLLVKAPPAPCVEGEVSGLTGEQRGKSLAFVTKVRNVGNIHAKPRVRVSIFKGDRAVAREYPVFENVIPGAERQFETVLREPLAAGEYVAQADVWMGFRHTTRRWRFRLTGTNRLPTPKLKIAKLAIAEPAPGEASEAKVVVANRGDAGADAQLRVVVNGAGRTLEQKIVDAGTLDGGADRSLTVPVSALPEGAYDLRVELLGKDGRVDVRATSFAVRGQPGLWTRVVGWLAAHVLAVLGGVLLLFLAAFAAVVVRLRRRRPTPEPAPEPAPAASPVDEIAELRAALERIERERTDRAA